MQRLIAGFALSVVLTGCASDRPKVFAHRNPAFSFSATNAIAVATHRQPRPEDAALGDALKAELTRRGLVLTAAEAADYILAYWVEDNWNSIRPAGAFYHGIADLPVGVKTYDGSPITSPGSLTVGVTADGREERYLVTQGIRLELYPSTRSGGTSLTPAWSGYIEAGSQLRLPQIPTLLHVLLEYFGQDFTGRARLAE